MSVPALRFKEFSGDWEVKVFADILIKNRLGGNYANSENETNYPLIKMGNLDRGNIKLNKIEYIIQDEVINPEDKINYGDLFFNTRNTLDLVGKVAIWRNELPKAYYNSNLMLIKFDNNFFMNYRLNSHNGMESLKAIATGTTSVAAIYTKDLLKIKLEIPSLPEQTKIANFLTAVDEKINLLTQKATLLSQYKKGVMQQIFSQELRFKDDDGQVFPEWEEKNISEVLKIGSGKDYKKLASGDIPVYGTGGYMLSVNDFLYDGESVCIGRKGTIDRPVLLTGKFWTVDTLFYTHSFIKSLPRFIYAVFQNIDWKNYNEASGVPSLSKSTIEKIGINIPSLPEQNKIANFLTAIDEKITNNKTQLDAVKQYKQGLLQQMFV